jgi:sigma-B regulation protein RsbU (phosphoserine phosphatase)
LHLDPGDFLLLYTDGVTDATDAQQQEFGMERLEQVVLDHRQAPVVELMAALERAIQDFVGSTAPFDDLAIVVAKCQS